MCPGVLQPALIWEGLALLPKSSPGVYILENTPPPLGGKISADVIWGKKYEKGKRKRGKCKRKRKKEEINRKKGERK
jgi:hypothetical protein